MSASFSKGVIQVAAPDPMAGASKPTLVLWGDQQTGRWAASTTPSAVGSDDGVPFDYYKTMLLRWKLDPSERWFGASASMVNIITDAAALDRLGGNAQSYPVNANAARGVYFSLWPGVWRVSGVICIENDYDEDVARVFRVIPGENNLSRSDEAVAEGVPDPVGEARVLGTPAFNTVATIPKSPMFLSAADDVFYVAYGGSQLGDAVDGNALDLTGACHLELEYLGAKESGS